MRAIALSVLLFACSLGLLSAQGPAQIKGRVSAPSRLPSGDWLKIEFKTVGCFHREEFSLAFRRGALREIGILKPRKSESQKEEFLGSLRMSHSQVARLDSTLQYYRSVPSTGGCTTVDTVKFTQTRNGRVVAEETFVDATCGMDWEENKPKKLLYMPEIHEQALDAAQLKKH